MSLLPPLRVPCCHVGIGPHSHSPYLPNNVRSVITQQHNRRAVPQMGSDELETRGNRNSTLFRFVVVDEVWLVLVSRRGYFPCLLGHGAQEGSVSRLSILSFEFPCLYFEFIHVYYIKK